MPDLNEMQFKWSAHIWFDRNFTNLINHWKDKIIENLQNSPGDESGNSSESSQVTKSVVINSQIQIEELRSEIEILKEENKSYKIRVRLNHIVYIFYRLNRTFRYDYSCKKIISKSMISPIVSTQVFSGFFQTDF